MAQAFSVEEIIGRPAPHVWTALTDWPNAHRWMPGIDTIAADGETAEGTRLTFRARGKDRSSTIVGCVAGQSIVLRSVQGGVRADYSYEVHPHGEGISRVTLTADCQSTGVLWRVMWPVVRIAIRASDAKQLRLLRATLEDA